MTHLVAKFGWRVIVFVFIAFAMGWLQTIGLVGFVRASELAEIRSDMASVKSTLQTRRIQEISGLMLDSKQKHCMAKGEAKRLYLESLNRLRDEYFMLTQRWASDVLGLRVGANYE